MIGRLYTSEIGCTAFLRFLECLKILVTFEQTSGCAHGLSYEKIFFSFETEVTK